MSGLDVRPAVAQALHEGRGVVALESTVIAHGLPWPQNLETTREMQAAVRQAGAEPAVIGVTGGTLAVGLEAPEIERFARDGKSVAKVSRRDLAAVMTRGRDGATTVAATMVAADRAGIRLFATGGIGGVHRKMEGDSSHDVSADLMELARTPVCVVASGAKSILDLPATLEALESLGVPVVGFGTRHFPTFYSRDASLPLQAEVATPAEAAALAQTHWRLDLGGLLLANPVPEAEALPTATVESWLAEALEAAAAEGVKGSAVTPFLLARLHARSGGRTLAANRALLVANARLAAEVAVECAPRP